MNSYKTIAFALLFALIFPACETGRSFTIAPPGRFAEYTEEKSFFKAISSDNIRLKVYSIRNEPYNDIGLWKGAVEHYLKGGGYHKSSERDISAPGGLKGTYTEYIIRYNGENNIYAVTLFADTKSIYIIETGGMESYYKKHREAIIGSITGFSVK